MLTNIPEMRVASKLEEPPSCSNLVLEDSPVECPAVGSDTAAINVDRETCMQIFFHSSESGEDSSVQ